MTEPASPRSSRGGSWRPILLLVLVVPLLLGLLAVLRSGGALEPVTTGVDWSAYPSSVHEAVDAAAKNLDCAGLAAQRAWASGPAASGVDAAPLVAYIDGIQRQLVCPR